MSDLEMIQTWAAQLGFDRLGVASASVELVRDHEHYQRFVDAGMHGAMGFLERNGHVRRGIGPEILPAARSVIVVAQRYAVREPTQGPQGILPLIAKYARGRDYHKHFRKQLKKLASMVATVKPQGQARALCDTAPLLERAWARLAGVGFIGKNGMLICPGLGSFVLLGEVATTLPLPVGTPMATRCGACTACLDACPTKAFSRPFVLDARKCLSYLTIELRGEAPPNEFVRSPWFFGCDACQDVCPYNRVSRSRIDAEGPYEPWGLWEHVTLVDVLVASDEQIERWTRGSPLRRARPNGLRVNALAALSSPLSEAQVQALHVMASNGQLPRWLRKRARDRLAEEQGDVGETEQEQNGGPSRRGTESD